MNTHLADTLTEAFPYLYANIYFECDDGWFMILWQLSLKLDPLGVQATQVKEKFGALRFYTDSSSDEIEAIILEAERLSLITCEACGRPGSATATSWIKTYCEDHANEM